MIPTTPALDSWSHSGKGAFLNYNDMLVVKWTIPKVKEFNQAVAFQAVFHSIWGTYCEDLSLLAYLTTEDKWIRRHEYGAFMEGFGTTKEYAQIKLPKFKKYSKLVSANITPFLTETTQQISSNPVFSGRSARHYGEELFQTLEDSTTSAGLRGKSATAMALEISQLAREIGEKIQKDDSLLTGTVDFRLVSDASRVEGVEGTVQQPPHLKGVYFLSRKDY